MKCDSVDKIKMNLKSGGLSDLSRESLEASAPLKVKKNILNELTTDSNFNI